MKLVPQIDPHLNNCQYPLINYLYINKELVNLMPVICATLKPRKPIFGSTTPKPFSVVLFVEKNFMHTLALQNKTRIEAWMIIPTMLRRNIQRLFFRSCAVMNSEFQNLRILQTPQIINANGLKTTLLCSFGIY